MAKEETSLDDHVVTLNPIVGVNLEDLARTGAQVLQAALLQPVVAAEPLAIPAVVTASALI